MLSAKQLKSLRAVAASTNRLAVARDLAGLTQAELAAATGFSQPYVSDVERNRYTTIEVDNAHRFADVFGCLIEDLFPKGNPDVTAEVA